MFTETSFTKSCWPTREPGTG